MWIWVAGLAMAGKEMLLCAIDQSEEPLGSASVLFAEEDGEYHRVNSATGCMAPDTLWEAGGAEVPLQKGVVVDLTVVAPGYAPERLHWVVSKKGLDVTLDPIQSRDLLEDYGVSVEETLARPDGDPLRVALEAFRSLSSGNSAGAIDLADRAIASGGEGLRLATAVRAFAYADRWKLAEVTLPSGGSESKPKVEREQAASAAKAWIALNASDPSTSKPDNSAAFALCYVATMDEADCR